MPVIRSIPGVISKTKVGVCNIVKYTPKPTEIDKKRVSFFKSNKINNINNIHIKNTTVNKPLDKN